MKASASPSDWLASRSPRERRVLAAGAIASVAIVVLALGILPFARRWEARRASIEVAAERVRRFEALVREEPRLAQQLEVRRRLARTGSLVDGVTPPVAASNVQSLLQQYARESGVKLDRVDVVGEPKPSDDGLATIPIQLAAQGDIHGLVALLGRVYSGDKLLLIDDIAIGAGATRGDSVQLLTFTLRLRGVWAPPLQGGS